MATNERWGRVHITNEERAEQGHQAVEEYAGTKEECLIDLLANLRHWAKANDVDFNACNHVADNHFQEET
jgi:predicted MarR family transcription regulator